MQQFSKLRTKKMSSNSSSGGKNQPVLLKIDQQNRRLFPEMFRYFITVLLTAAAVSVALEKVDFAAQHGFDNDQSFKAACVSKTDTTLKDVKGCDEVKKEVEEIISYLHEPEKFNRLGARLPKGILLCGHPGTGKTLIARAIAGEANVPFFHVTGSDFEDKYVGVGARRIRALFEAARSVAPSVIFIDEIDAVGYKRRSQGRQALTAVNQLLVELDGFSTNSNVVVICATNLPDRLDNALTRPGRLDKKIVVPRPDFNGRQEILELFAKRLVLDPAVDLSILARRTAGMTGAELNNILNVAAIKSSMENKPSVDMEALDAAFDRVVIGLVRNTPMSEEDKLLTAYHEAGHALVAAYTKLSDPPVKITIVPRGDALGYTCIEPKDRNHWKASDLEARLSVLLAGKAAEVLMYGSNHATTGCSSDLEKATTIARNMICTEGMGSQTTHVPMFTAMDGQHLSEQTLQKIDATIQQLLNAAYDRAFLCLSSHKDKLREVAQILVQVETVDFHEIKMILEDKGAQVLAARLPKGTSGGNKLGVKSNPISPTASVPRV